MTNEHIHALERQLSELLGPQLRELITAIVAQPDRTNPYLLEIPDTNTIDLSMDELASLVARSSNNYARVARFAGMARAEAKLAKGRYERKFKRAQTQGRNDKERAANALETSIDEHTAMVNAEAIAEIADSLENAARIASESARKIFDKASNVQSANRREQVGYLQESDFSTF